MSDLSQAIQEALARDPDAVIKMIGRRMTSLLASGETVSGAVLVLPVKDRAPDVPLNASFAKLIPWEETDRYRLQAIRNDDGLELLLTYD